MAYRRIDCATWDKLLGEIMGVMQQFEGKYSASGVPFFRGHCSPTYQLLPGLFRPTATGMYTDYDEKNFYYEFRARVQPWLTRFRLSAPAVAETRRFLKVMGVNDFSLFPDLDGLSRFLRKRIRGGYGIVA